MIQTIAALFLAHVLADFVFQTRWMVTEKHRPQVLLLHGAVVLACSLALIGRVDAWQIYALAAAHLAIDLAKLLWTKPRRAKLVGASPSDAKLAGGRHVLAAYLADQGAHLAVIGVTAVWFPTLWAGGYWAGLPGSVPAAMLAVAGAIFATRAGGFAVGMLMSRFVPRAETGLSEGLPGAGEVIGILERGLTYLFILLGEFEAVGFLLAAKSILRFGAIKEDRAASEYVLIGTLASFAWAIAVAFAIRALIGGT